MFRCDWNLLQLHCTKCVRKLDWISYNQEKHARQREYVKAMNVESWLTETGDFISEVTISCRLPESPCTWKISKSNPLTYEKFWMQCLSDSSNSFAKWTNPRVNELLVSDSSWRWVKTVQSFLYGQLPLVKPDTTDRNEAGLFQIHATTKWPYFCLTRTQKRRPKTRWSKTKTEDPLL